MCSIRGLLSREIRLSFHRYFCLSSYYSNTHYDVLELKRDCSQKEIKSAFIKLSKKYHPDKNVANSTHSMFVKLNEAYTVLSRPESRREYDLSLVPEFAVRRPRSHYYDPDFSQSNPYKVFHDKSFWANRDKSRDAEYAARPYYGIKGLKRVPNAAIVALLFLFTLLGIGVQVILISESMTFSRKVLDERSAKNIEILRLARERALKDDGKSSVIDVLRRMSDAQDVSKEESTDQRK